MSHPAMRQTSLRSSCRAIARAVGAPRVYNQRSLAVMVSDDSAYSMIVALCAVSVSYIPQIRIHSLRFVADMNPCSKLDCATFGSVANRCWTRSRTGRITDSRPGTPANLLRQRVGGLCCHNIKEVGMRTLRAALLIAVVSFVPALAMADESIAGQWRGCSGAQRHI